MAACGSRRDLKQKRIDFLRDRFVFPAGQGLRFFLNHAQVSKLLDPGQSLLFSGHVGSLKSSFTSVRCRDLCKIACVRSHVTQICMLPLVGPCSTITALLLQWGPAAHNHVHRYDSDFPGGGRAPPLAPRQCWDLSLSFLVIKR